MPRLFKRLTLAFAVLALGILLAGFLALLWLAHQVRTNQTEPVRQQLVADWERNADAFEKNLTTAASWNTPGERTPPELGCQLRWAGDSSPVLQHLARCGATQPLDDDTLGALEALGDKLLTQAQTAPLPERDLSWMAQLRGHDDWSSVEGTPFEFFDVNGSFIDAPVISVKQVRALALVRLLQGQRSGALEPAVEDVTAFARALLGRPFVLDQLVGVAVLERTRAALDAAGHPELGTRSAEIVALRGARLAAAFLWHPWVPKAQRERFLPKLAPASRCAAAAEDLLVLEIGPPLQENYPGFLADFRAWKATRPCTSDFITRALDAREHLPEASWQRLLGTPALPGGLSRDDISSRLLLELVENTALGRATITELIFSVTLARPFAIPAPD